MVAAAITRSGADECPSQRTTSCCIALHDARAICQRMSAVEERWKAEVTSQLQSTDAATER